MNADGNAFLSKATGTVVRSVHPRDGGVTIAAFADWITEFMDTAVQFLALYDDDMSGAVLLVFRLPATSPGKGKKPTARYRVVLLGSDVSPSDFCETKIFTSFGPEFRTWFAKSARALWTEDRDGDDNSSRGFLDG